jgi:hypothetical protein
MNVIFNELNNVYKIIAELLSCVIITQQGWNWLRISANQLVRFKWFTVDPPAQGAEDIA